MYSKAPLARAYRAASKQMPIMTLVASFGESDAVRSLREYMGQYVKAETLRSNEYAPLLDVLDQRDTGPFLYWLLNHASKPQRSAFSTFLTEMVRPRPTPLRSHAWPMLGLLRACQHSRRIRHATDAAGEPEDRGALDKRQGRRDCSR